jgi:hypothetical protein
MINGMRREKSSVELSKRADSVNSSSCLIRLVNWSLVDPDDFESDTRLGIPVSVAGEMMCRPRLDLRRYRSLFPPVFEPLCACRFVRPIRQR